MMKKKRLYNKSKKRRRQTRQVIFITGIIAFVFAISSTVILIINNQKIARGVKVANLELGGQDVEQASQMIQTKWQQITAQPIIFLAQIPNKNEGITLESSLTDLGFSINAEKTAEKAYWLCHQSNLLIQLKHQIGALFGRGQSEIIYQTNQEKLKAGLNRLLKDIERPVQNASLSFDQATNEFLLVPASQGISVDREKLLADLLQRVKALSLEPIYLTIHYEKPVVENNEIDLARQKAEQILDNQPYQLILDKRIWLITQKELLKWLIFKPVQSENNPNNQILDLFLDQEQILNYLKKITRRINRWPINARLETAGNRAIVFVPDEPGYGINIEETATQLSQNILSNPPVKKTIVKAQKLLPQITLAQTNELGIHTLIGQGRSNFAGSPQNRIHNIKTGTNKFHLLILNPDEEFSFVNLLGGSGPEQGFLPELVIKKNKTIPEYGGGLCQVSTTLFRAAVNAGLKITERRNHSFPVQYYSPIGFDATIYEPHPDLRFINNTPGHLLIEAKIIGSQLIFNFYGADDGRQVKVKGPYVLEKNEDGSMKTVLYQEVYQNGKLLSTETFYSNYKSPDLFPVETIQTGAPPADTND